MADISQQPADNIGGPKVPVGQSSSPVYTINTTDAGVTITESSQKTIAVQSLILDVARLTKESNLLTQKVADIATEISVKQTAIDDYNAANGPAPK